VNAIANDILAAIREQSRLTAEQTHAINRLADTVASQAGEVLLTTTQASQILGVSADTVRTWCSGPRQRHFPGARSIGTGQRRHWRIPLRDVMARQEEMVARDERRRQAKGA
jgi:Helix-turn-helix domain